MRMKVSCSSLTIYVILYLEGISVVSLAMSIKDTLCFQFQIRYVIDAVALTTNQNDQSLFDVYYPQPILPFLYPRSKASSISSFLV
jgi:hypothetical protein